MFIAKQMTNPNIRPLRGRTSFVYGKGYKHETHSGSTETIVWFSSQRDEMFIGNGEHAQTYDPCGVERQLKKNCYECC